jgi:hypothetical protein
MEELEAALDLNAPAVAKAKPLANPPDKRPARKTPGKASPKKPA